MRNVFLFLFINLSISISLFSQQYEYVPFPTHSAIWVEHHTAAIGSLDDSSHFYCYGLKNNDRTINGITYHMLYCSTDTIFQESEIIGAIREKDKIVYMAYIVDDSVAVNERKLYDFSLLINDSIKEPEYRLSYPKMEIVMKIDTILFDSQFRKKLYFGPSLKSNPFSFAYWIEGIGYARGLLYPTGTFPTNGLWNDLVCFWQDGKEVYHDDSGAYPGCFEYLSSSIKTETNECIVHVFPNPFVNECIFNFSANEKYEELSMYNLYGKMIFKASVKNKESFTFINKQNLKAGMYLYMLTGKSKNSFKGKVLVK